jgi:hypothetical protein
VFSAIFLGSQGFLDHNVKIIIKNREPGSF